MFSKDGPILAITDCCESPTVVVEMLKNAQRQKNFTELLVRGIRVDDEVSAALLDMFQNEQRKWNCMEVLNCEGKVEHALSSAVASDAIQQLRLVNLEMEGSGFRMFGKALQGNTSLTALRLTIPSLSGEDVRAIAEGLRENKTLELLDFKWSSFSTQAITELAKGLQSNKTLRYLHFYGCELNDHQISTIVNSLVYHPAIETLDFNGNNCGPKAALALAKMLEFNDCTLQHLDLSYQRGGGGGSGNERISIPLLANSLRFNKSLQTLDLSGGLLCEQDAILLAKALTTNVTLQELYLARNKITVNGICVIAANLSQMRGLKKLSLWGNTIQEVGAQALLQGLQDNMELETLDLFERFKCSDQIQHLTSLNRVGRKIFKSCPNTIPLALWPLIFERANKKRMAKGSPSIDAKARVDAIYHMLRGPALMDGR